MNKKATSALCLLGLSASFAFAHDKASSVPMESIVLVPNKDVATPLLFSITKRVKEHEHNIGHPIPKSIVFAPEVTIQENTVHFVTPCDGYELCLVKDDIIIYSTEIDSDTLTIPNTIHGTCELQIVTEDYILHTEVTLP